MDRKAERVLVLGPELTHSVELHFAVLPAVAYCADIDSDKTDSCILEQKFEARQSWMAVYRLRECPLRDE